MKRILFTVLILSVAGCTLANPNVTPEGLKINIVENKPTDCQSLGKIDTTMYSARDKNQAMNIFRNHVVKKGGDTARITDAIKTSYTDVIGSNKYYGMKGYMYKCKK